MPKVFQGVKCLLIGVSNKQRQIIAKNIIREDGVVLNYAASGSLSSSPPNKDSKLSSTSKNSDSIINSLIQRNVFTPVVVNSSSSSAASSSSSSSPDQASQTNVMIMEYINKGCTHIVSEKRNLTSESLSHYLQCPLTEIVNLKMPIVHTTWVTSSLAAKMKLNDSQFQIMINDSGSSSNTTNVSDDGNDRQSKKLRMTDDSDVGINSSVEDSPYSKCEISERDTTDPMSGTTVNNVGSELNSKDYDKIETDININETANPECINLTTVGSTSSQSNNNNNKRYRSDIDHHQQSGDRSYNSRRYVVMSKVNTRIDIITPLKEAQYKHIPMLPFLYTTTQPSSSSSSSDSQSQSHSYTLDASRLQGLYTACTPDGQWHEYNNMIFKLSPLNNYSNVNIANTTIPSVPESIASSSNNLDHISAIPSTVPPQPSVPITMEYIGFDMDGTLIKTQSGRVFPKDEKDWTFWSNDVKKKIKQIIVQEKKHVVIISNQNGIAKGKITRKQLQSKVDTVLKSLYIEIYGAAAVAAHDSSISSSTSTYSSNGALPKSIANFFKKIAPPAADNNDKAIATNSNESGSSSSVTNASSPQNTSSSYIGGIDFICSIDSDDSCRKPLTGCWDMIRLVREHQLMLLQQQQQQQQQLLMSNYINNESMNKSEATTASPFTANVSLFCPSSSSSLSPLSVAVTMLLFVGDAAGRQQGIPMASSSSSSSKSSSSAKDFSDSDIKFALNVGCDFATPEEYFSRSTGMSARSEFKGGALLTSISSIGASNSIASNSANGVVAVSNNSSSDEMNRNGVEKRGDSPEQLRKQQRDELIKTILTPAYSTTTTAANTAESVSNNNLISNAHNNITNLNHQQSRLEIVLLVAPPACGKSTLARSLFVVNNNSNSSQLLGGYVRINRDTLGSMEKCMHHARIALTGSSNSNNAIDSNTIGRSVVVDNTNTELHQRGLWIQLARELNTPIRCVCLETTLGIALSLQQIRLLSPDVVDASERREIPEWVIEKFFKEYRSPQLNEGFTRIDKIPFVLDVNASRHPITKRLYESYL